MKSEIERLTQENESMVEGFRISSDMLLERLKDLESANFAGERPQTAQVLGRLNGGGDAPLRRPKIMDDYEPPQILKLEQSHGDDDKAVPSGPTTLCTNCNTKIPENQFPLHTVKCIRNSKK